MKRTELKEKPQLTRYERETIINFNNQEKEAVLYTCDASVIRYMDALVDKFPEKYYVTEEIIAEGEVFARTYSFPKKYARPKRPVVISEERKEQLTRQLENARSAKEAGECKNSKDEEKEP